MTQVKPYKETKIEVVPSFLVHQSTDFILPIKQAFKDPGTLSGAVINICCKNCSGDTNMLLSNMLCSAAFDLNVKRSWIKSLPVQRSRHGLISFLNLSGRLTNHSMLDYDEAMSRLRGLEALNCQIHLTAHRYFQECGVHYVFKHESSVIGSPQRSLLKSAWSLYNQIHLRIWQSQQHLSFCFDTPAGNSAKDYCNLYENLCQCAASVIARPIQHSKVPLVNRSKRPRKGTDSKYPE